MRSCGGATLPALDWCHTRSLPRFFKTYVHVSVGRGPDKTGNQLTLLRVQEAMLL